MTETLYTVEEAAQRLKMHPDTLRRQLRQGRIKSVRTGKLWRIPESAFSASKEPSKLENLESPKPASPGGGQMTNAIDFDALFTVSTPAEVAQRLEAWESFGRSVLPQKGAAPLSDDAVAQGYDERAAQLMEGHR